ncbi:MAG TPA: amino acid ABC transporter substrate-binding protein [Stellaceae bacterium]|nr:amino acid ABC transporter substrate-binding protein [Stellaceae bacterium]
MKHLWAIAPIVAALGAGPAFAQTNTITLGTAVQLTGKDANTGRYYRDGYQFTIDKINEKGGITVGGKKYNLKLDVLDNQSDTNLDVQLYTKLITQDKVDFLLGSYSSAVVLVDTSVAEKFEMPMVQGGGAASQIFTRGYKWIFGTLPRAEDYFSSTIAMMGELNPKPKTVALITADDAFDVSVAQGTRELLKKAGLETVLDQQYAANSADFSSVLTLLKSKQPDVVLWGGLLAEVLNSIRQAKSLDVSAKDMTSFTVGVPTADFRKALDKDAEYAFGMTPWVPTGASKDDYFGDDKTFNDAYTAKFGYEPDYHAASAAADVEVYAKAITKAGSLDKTKVRDAIAASDFQSLYAHVKFASNGQINVPQIAIQIQDGKIVPVFGQKMINKPRYPVPGWDKR